LLLELLFKLQPGFVRLNAHLIGRGLQLGAGTLVTDRCGALLFRYPGISIGQALS